MLTSNLSILFNFKFSYFPQNRMTAFSWVYCSSNIWICPMYKHLKTFCYFSVFFLRLVLLFYIEDTGAELYSYALHLQIPSKVLAAELASSLIRVDGKVNSVFTKYIWEYCMSYNQNKRQPTFQCILKLLRVNMKHSYNVLLQ